MTTTAETHSTPETDSTSDHETTPDRETSPPIEDPQDNTKVKITEPIRPRHHDPLEIHFSVAGAPSQWMILRAAGKSARRPNAQWIGAAHSVSAPSPPAPAIRGRDHVPASAVAAGGASC